MAQSLKPTPPSKTPDPHAELLSQSDLFDQKAPKTHSQLSGMWNQLALLIRTSLEPHFQKAAASAAKPTHPQATAQAQKRTGAPQKFSQSGSQSGFKKDSKSRMDLLNALELIRAQSQQGSTLRKAKDGSFAVILKKAPSPAPETPPQRPTQPLFGNDEDQSQ